MKKGLLIGLIAGVLVLGVAIGAATAVIKHFQANRAITKVQDGDSSDDTDTLDEDLPDLAAPAGMERPKFLAAEQTTVSYTPSVAPYHTDMQLSNIVNKDYVYLQDAQLKKLVENNFVVSGRYDTEFFAQYEDNRYFQFPNFVTTDSMMHTYHLYFAMLQKKTEKRELFSKVDAMSKAMLEESRKQYETLKGSEWEEAALLNYTFFTVGANLMDPSSSIDAPVSELAEAELSLIKAEGGVSTSPLFNEYEDYSQYKPRGYYEGDEQLERYFRGMMWYGRRNFSQKSELLDRSALLMTMALNDCALSEWESVYAVTAFFAGASDDSGYYEYMPLIREAFGEGVQTEDLIGNKKGFQKFHKMTATLAPPKINSVPFDDDEGKTDKTQEAKGFRFMGQRFSLDEAVFTQLTYSKVEETADGKQRLLPDALDVPAALGSKKAYEILKEDGQTAYPNYDEQLSKAQEEISKMPELWTGSLYAAWMNTLNPLLTEKGEGYPSFMTNDEWTKKSLESYLGSWTELKHDTVLYSKQMMAEMGGGDIEVIDDRGYVEPVPELYEHLKNLTKDTANGLKQYGLLDAQDEEDLNRLAELSGSLCEISVKELQNEKLTDDEYELIRAYGGSLEHFWNETVKATTGEEYNNPEEFPACLVVDVATDPNGSVLEEAVGGLSTIYVVVPVDGSLRVASGIVYNYYQFTQPISDRLTDSEWRRMTGLEIDENYERHEDPDLELKKPEWTKSYRQDYVYESNW
ncbi:MAG: DUF3160 domain-containing protein [Lachnospiraceae bacterium]|nr:DUF3160 domain-containing protein [Lachnospiraceae bacterium]